MKSVNWKKLAAISEIVGTIVIVISLAFVAQSISQNTDALQNTNLNHVYDRIDSANGDIAADPQLAKAYAQRVFSLEDISAIDAQYLVTMRRELAQWEQYFSWHQRLMLEDGEWEDWDQYYMTLYRTALPEEWWLAIRRYYSEPFASHVDQIYSK